MGWDKAHQGKDASHFEEEACRDGEELISGGVQIPTCLPGALLFHIPQLLCKADCDHINFYLVITCKNA